MSRPLASALAGLPIVAPLTARYAAYIEAQTASSKAANRSRPVRIGSAAAGRSRRPPVYGSASGGWAEHTTSFAPRRYP